MKKKSKIDDLSKEELSKEEMKILTKLIGTIPVPKKNSAFGFLHWVATGKMNKGLKKHLIKQGWKAKNIAKICSEIKKDKEVSHGL